MTRESTEAEKRAWEAALAVIGPSHADAQTGLIYVEPLPSGEVSAEIDLMAVTRAVIRSLREPSMEVRGAIFAIGPLMLGDSIGAFMEQIIDAASPEIKP